MIIIGNSKIYRNYEYRLEEEIEKDVLDNCFLIFGKDSVFINAKKKIVSGNLGASIPDGFLFDFSDMENPVFYIVEVETKGHDFYRHIFPQITKFLSFFNSASSISDLANKLYAVIEQDDAIKKQFKGFLKDEEIFKFLSEVINDSQNILLVIDGEKAELPEIQKTYQDTWGRKVKVAILKKFISGKETQFVLDPELELIDLSQQGVEAGAEEGVDSPFSESFHVSYANEPIQKIYGQLREKIGKKNPNIRFNPTKNYIGIKYEKNIAYVKFRKNTLVVVVMMNEKDVRSRIGSYKIRSLGESVQKYWNGECCDVIVDSDKDISSLADLICDLAQG